MDANEQKARELLAAEYERAGMPDSAARTLHPNGFARTPSSDPAIRAIMAALAQQVPADGEWVLVPREATPQMLAQFVNFYGGGDWMAAPLSLTKRQLARARKAYSLMLAAAAQAPQPVVGSTIGQQAVDVTDAMVKAFNDAIPEMYSHDLPPDSAIRDGLAAALAAHGKGG